jgi:hypothetical protein
MNKTPLFYKDEIVLYCNREDDKIPCVVIEAHHHKRNLVGWNERYIIKSLDPEKQFTTGISSRTNFDVYYKNANFCAGEYLEKTNINYQEIDTIKIFEELSS